MTDAYAKAGVDQGTADDAVAALVRALGGIRLDRPSAQVPLPGHYASVIRIADNLGVALSTDGVGTKLVLAEQLGKLDTVGIDCVAMNVNDVICVGAEPLAMLDYVAIDRASVEVCEQIGVGLARGATLAGIEIPGGELAQLGEMVHGVDVSGACFGTVALDAIVDGGAVAPGDVVIGLPSSGLHSNGYTLARAALAGLDFDADPGGRLGRPLGEALLEPTEIYVKPIIELLRSPVAVHGLAHITSGGVNNLLRLAAEVGLRDRRAAAGPGDLRADPGAGRRRGRGDARGLQHGLRLLRRRPGRRRGNGARDAARALPRGGADRPRGRRRAARPPLAFLHGGLPCSPVHGLGMVRGRNVRRLIRWTPPRPARR